MANLDDKMKQAYILSSKALNSSNFDTDAFLVASMLRLLKYDVVPESQIDEMTDESKILFVEYMQNKTDDNLKKYLLQIHQILSELYHTVSEEQRLIIKEKIENLQKIV